MTNGRMAFAILMLSGLSWATHRYVWARLIRDAAWPAPWNTVLTAGICVLAALVPLVFVATRWMPRSANAPLAWTVYTWLGFALYLLLLTALTDAALGIAAVAGALPEDPERRRFLARAVAVGVGVLSALVGVGGAINVARGFAIKRVRIPVARLPRAAAGYAIVQITDVHVGPTIGSGFIEEIVAHANALSPDAIAITGDLVDGSVAELARARRPAGDAPSEVRRVLRHRQPRVLLGADEWIAHLATLGVRVLRNERVPIGGRVRPRRHRRRIRARLLHGHGQDVAKRWQGAIPRGPGAPRTSAEGGRRGRRG